MAWAWWLTAGNGRCTAHVGAQDVGQDDSVSPVGLLAGPRAGPGGARRSAGDREDPSAGRAELDDQQATRGLDGHRDRRLGGVAGCDRRVSSSS